MPINKRYKAPFFYESFYHVYNRSVSGQLLFYDNDNYIYFLKKFDEYLSDILKIYAWCLIPNHFHFLVSVKRQTECVFSEKEKERLENRSASLHAIIGRRYKNFFLAYSLALKKQRNINTNVFAQHFKHIGVEKNAYLSQLIYYIHRNPLNHKITYDWQNYPWSSYQRIISDVQSNLQVQFVLNWFGGKDNFIRYHQRQGSEPLERFEP